MIIAKWTVVQFEIINVQGGYVFFFKTEYMSIMNDNFKTVQFEIINVLGG